MSVSGAFKNNLREDVLTMREVSAELKSMVIEGKFSRQFICVVTLPSTGELMYVDCQTKDRTRALEEVHQYIDCLQKETGETVMWKFRGENIVHMGLPKKETLKDKAKAFIVDFFDL